MVGSNKIRRRRDQPRVELLAPIPRLLNNICAIHGKTQASVAELLRTAPLSSGVFAHNAASAATISRWFRGDTIPTDDDLRTLAGFLDIAVENFFALRFLEDLQKKQQHNVASIGGWHFIASAGKTLVLGGISMVSRVIHLRDVDLTGKTVILSSLSAAALASASPELDPNLNLGPYHRWCWLAALDTMLALSRRHPTARFRLWIRDHQGIDAGGTVGQLAANEWIAIEAVSPYAQSFTIHVRGDEYWSSFVQPTMDRLHYEDRIDRHELLYDSKWAEDDPRLEHMLEYRSDLADTAKRAEGLRRPVPARKPRIARR